MDTGYYECRAMNVVAREPAVGRVRVIITSIKPSVPLNRTHNKPILKKQPSRNPQELSTPFASFTPVVDSNRGTTSGPMWPLKGRPCPISDFCLNGGTCTLFEAIGEYVCQ